jgi:hypothetical protein
MQRVGVAEQGGGADMIQQRLSGGAPLRCADAEKRELVAHVGAHRWRSLWLGGSGEGNGDTGKEVRFHASCWRKCASFRLVMDVKKAPAGRRFLLSDPAYWSLAFLISSSR